MTSTELGYLSGVTSNIQDQLNGKALSSHDHDSIKIDLASAYDAERRIWMNAIQSTDQIGYPTYNDNLTYNTSTGYLTLGGIRGQLHVKSDNWPTLTIFRNNSNDSTLRFINSNGRLGYISFTGSEGKLIVSYGSDNVEYEIISTKNISNYALPASGGPITGGLINAIENGSIIESGGYTLLGYGDVAVNQVTGSLFGSGAGATSIRSSTAANLFHYAQDTNSSYKIFTDWWIRYGIELPDTGTMGQIFFLKSS